MVEDSTTAPSERTALRRATGPSWPFDPSRLRRMLANEADMSFKGRAEAVYDFLAIGPGDRVLDMGCGRGFYLKFTRELYPHADVVGVELDRPLLATAKAQVPGVRTVNGNVYRLPFADGAFDKILFTEVIEHIPDDRAALRELARVLAPGGRIAITTPNADYPLAWDPLNKVLETAIGRPIRRGVLSGIWANHERLYTPESLAAKVAEAGLRVERTRCITRWAFPFIHNLVYGLGKELLVAGRLPPSLAVAADRFDTSSRAGGLFNPIRWGLAAFNAVDRLNTWFPPRPDAPFLIIALCAVKPEDGR
ncbi:MAG: methyltransferase domain-containing protein [Ardenticatenales bacterium]